jgi:hypothetical protein
VTARPREPLHLIVDSEVFEVVEDPDQPGGCHYVWTSGPNAGYGFTNVPSDGHRLTLEERLTAIRVFLESINPATGFLD